MATAAVVKTDPIEATIRTDRGSRKAQALRASGRLPGIIYGRKQDAVAVELPGALTEAAIHRGAHILDLVIEGKTEKVLVQDVQYDYLQAEIEHVDLLRVDPNQTVKVKVPLDFRGTPKGTKEGGILETQITELELEVLVTAIPDIIRVNVENLELHGAIHAKDVALPEGAKLVNPPEQILVQVRTVKEQVAATEEPGAVAEPEVIGKKPTDEEAAAAAPAAGAKAAPAKK